VRQLQIGELDPYRDVKNWSHDQARVWAQALEARANSLDQQRLRHHLIDLTNLESGDLAVEVGCGTGNLLLDLAKAVGSNGKVLGVEPQRELAALAHRKLCVTNVAFEILDASAEHLPIADGIAATALAQTVLIHLPLAAALNALREMARVTCIGGRVISVDHDGDTWIIDHPDRELTRRIIQFNSDQRFADGWRGRQLRRLFLEAGLEEVEVHPWVHADTECPSYLFTLAERIATAAGLAEAITRQECESWLDALLSTVKCGRFFSSLSFFIAVGVKPKA